MASVAHPSRYRYLPPRFVSRSPIVHQTLLGRRQVVRQRILIPSFGGSIPPAPANPPAISECGLAGCDVGHKVRVAMRHPLGNLGQDKNIADAIVFLASDRAAFMTGSEMVVDGGFTAQ